MTDLAILARVKFLSNKRLVYIFMTILTVNPYRPEAPFLLFPVAINAWDCLMRAIKREHCLVMLLKCIGKHGKALHIMTVRAIRGNTILCKLPVMIIVMAICASVMLYRISVFRLVTFIAIYGKMLILKLECSFTMVEATRLLYVQKGILRMTLPAVLAKLILMRIFMAICAVGKLYPPEFLEFLPVNCLNLMAFKAINRFMLSLKLKPCFIVVELRGLLE